MRTPSAVATAQLNFFDLLSRATFGAALFNGTAQPSGPSSATFRIPAEACRERSILLDACSPLELTVNGRLEANLRALSVLRGGSGDREDLLRFTGFGGLSAYLDPRRPEGVLYRARLAAAGITERELIRLEGNVKNAHYTPYGIIAFGWALLRKLGFMGGRVLEPSCGVLNIMGLCPADLPVAFTGVEIEPLTAEIARRLYPDAEVITSPFEHAELATSFDLVFTNVPFGSYPAQVRRDDAYAGLRPLIHDYCLLRSTDLIRPGGYAVYITSTGTLDKVDKRVRSLLAEKASLVTAFRLPSGTFSRNTHSEVTTDLLVFQKRIPGGLTVGHSFVNTGAEPVTGLRLNEFYLRFPQQILGVLERGGMKCADQGRVVGLPIRDLERELDRRLLEDPFLGLQTPSAPEPFCDVPPRTARLPAPADYRTGEVYVAPTTGCIYRVIEQHLAEMVVPSDERPILNALFQIKCGLKALLRAQLTDEEGPVHELQASLSGAIRRFVSQHTTGGPTLKCSALSQWFGCDPYRCRLEGLVQENGALADILTKRTLFSRHLRREDPDASTSLEEVATFVQLHDRDLNVTRIAEIKGWESHETGRRLLESGIAFRDPAQDGKLVHKLEYLSGPNIYEKIDLARQAELSSPHLYAGNMEALIRITPKRRLLEEISLSTRQRFFPVSLFGWFLSDHLQAPYTVTLLPNNELAISGHSPLDQELGKAERTYSEAFEAFANGKHLRLPTRAKGGDEEETNAQKQALRRLELRTSEDFQRWILANRDLTIEGETDPIGNVIEETYNRCFNAAVQPAFDGSLLRWDGLSSTFKGRPFVPKRSQVNEVARMMFQGAGGCGHKVGKGKTIIGLLTAVAWLQSGLCRKIGISVPKKVLFNWARELADLFPALDVIIVDTFDGIERDRILGDISLSAASIVLFTHDHLKSIPNNPETEARYIEEEIAKLKSELRGWEGTKSASAAKRKKKSMREIEEQLARFEARVQRLRDFDGRTKAIYFDELGIDGLIVDEWHHFKRLMVRRTGIDRDVLGVSTGESQRALDLYLKCRQVLDLQDGKGVMLLTGTPIDNSMTEIYNTMRFLDPRFWDKLGIHSLSDWISNFAEVNTIPQVLVDGSFGMRQVLCRYRNLRELKALFRRGWSTSDNQPCTSEAGEEPQPNEINIIVPATTAQKDYFVRIVTRAEEVRQGNIHPTDDNFLKITTDGRKAALDMRLCPEGADLPSEEWGNKVFRLTQEILNRRATGEELSPKAQLVFCDLYNRQALSEAAYVEDATATDPMHEALLAKKEDALNLHQEIRASLILAGIPEERIVLLNGRSNGTAKEQQDVTDRYQRGEIDVLIGTSFSMGEGKNLQNFTVAIHHLDAPLKPAQMTQRNGRGLRPGNRYKVVDVLYYTTRGSFDQYVYQLLNRKADFIGRFLTEKEEVELTSDDPNMAQALNYEQIMAATHADPRVREFFTKRVRLGEVEQARTACGMELQATSRHLRTQLDSTAAMRARKADCEAARAQYMRDFPGVEIKLADKLPLALTWSDKTGATRSVRDEDGIAETLDRWLHYCSFEGELAFSSDSSFPAEGFSIGGMDFAALSDKRAPEPLLFRLSRDGGAKRIGGSAEMKISGQLTGMIRRELRRSEETIENARLTIIAWEAKCEAMRRKMAALESEAETLGCEQAAMAIDVETLGRALKLIDEKDEEETE